MKKLIFLLMTASLLIGCGGVQKIEPVDFSKYVWPPSPYQARVKLLNVIQTDLDIRERTKTELLFGETIHFAFKKPHGIAVGMDGIVYVSDSYLGRVFTIDLVKGTLGELFNPYGWRQLSGLATDNINGLFAATSSNVVYVVDQKSKKVLLTLGAKEGLENPVGVAFDPYRKRIYVADSYKHEVHAYDYDGRHITVVASLGSDTGEVYYPLSVAVDKNGDLYVVDSMNFRVQIFNPDFSFQRAFGEHGDMPGMFARPKSIAINKDGLLFITDAAFSNFQIFKPDGTIFGFVGAPGGTAGRFNQPQGIAVDKDDKIYVVDQTNRRLQIFQYMSDEYLASHPEDVVDTPEARRQRGMATPEDLEKMNGGAQPQDTGRRRRR